MEKIKNSTQRILRFFNKSERFGDFVAELAVYLEKWQIGEKNGGLFRKTGSFLKKASALPKKVAVWQRNCQFKQKKPKFS